MDLVFICRILIGFRQVSSTLHFGRALDQLIYIMQQLEIRMKRYYTVVSLSYMHWIVNGRCWCNMTILYNMLVHTFVTFKLSSTTARISRCISNSTSITATTTYYWQ